MDEETTHQNNGISKQQVRQEPETFLNKALQESEKELETALQQTKAAEEDYQEGFSITAVRFHDGEKDEERREENFCSGLSDTEQRLREELTRTEIRVVLLSNQLSRKHQDAKNFQRQIQKMEQQLTVREDRKENFRTQLDKEQRLRAELNERETTEILLRKQLREKDCQEASLQRTLCEQERQLEKERRLREELIEKEATEILLRKQLREMDCQEAHFRMQLRMQKQQLEEKVKGDETLGEQFQEMERRLREEITEKDARQVVLCEKITEKDQQLTEMIQQLTVTVEREEDLKTQIKNVEEQLRENEEQVENLRTNLKDVEKRLTQKEAQEENLRLSLEQMEQRMREELTQKETRETELRKQLSEREEQAVDYQRHLSGMEQQLSEKNDQKETLLKQLREMEQRSREVTAENEMRENEFREQLREREQELREMAHQLTAKEQQEENLRAQIRMHLMEQRLREEMIEEATRLGEELRERDQQIENFQMQLQGLREQLREKDQHLANVRTQLDEREVPRTDFQHQFREIVAENSNLRQQVVNLENQAGSQSNDWVISRDDIQLTDNSLGVGGWGEVFEGRYCGCSVAVKRIHEAINSPYNQSLFQREIDIASRCRHPCLLQFIGATNDEEIPLFVTELMESNLRELLGQRPLSRKEITVISLDVARALNYLHQKKPFPIFHRDVSSGNVLLWRQGDQWRGKVSDYGSAKFEEQFMSIGPGCFAYSAPEVQRPAKHTAKVRK